MIARALLVLVLLLPPTAFAADPITKTWTAPTVSLEIRAPNGTVKKFTGVPWTLGMTVLDTMKMVDGITFTGKWSRSLSDWQITSIDGLANQNAAGPNWLLCMFGAPAGVGAGSYVLGPEAMAIWIYSTWPPQCT